MIADNLDLGRPDNVEIIFNRRARRDTIGPFGTAIDRGDNGGVVVNVFYKRSRIKQYLKEGRCGSRPLSMPHATWPATPYYPTPTTSRPRPVRSTAGS
jgi:hypothetical protein